MWVWRKPRNPAALIGSSSPLSVGAEPDLLLGEDVMSKLVDLTVSLGLRIRPIHPTLLGLQMQLNGS